MIGLDEKIFNSNYSPLLLLDTTNVAIKKECLKSRPEWQMQSILKRLVLSNTSSLSRFFYFLTFFISVFYQIKKLFNKWKVILFVFTTKIIIKDKRSLYIKFQPKI